MKKLGIAALALLALSALVPLLRAASGPRLGFDPQVFILDSDGSGLNQVSRGGGWKSHPTWSPKGDRLAFVHQGIRVFAIATGRVRRIPHSRRTGAGSVAWSPRREELVAVFGTGTEDRPRGHVATLDARSGRLRRLVSWMGGTAGKGDPAWSPDGNNIVYARERARNSGGDPYCICGPTNVAVVSRNGNGERIFELHGDEYYPQWSPNGRWLLFGRRPQRESFGLWKVTSRGRRLQRVGPPIVYARDPFWSHDGARVSFTGHSDTGARDQALFTLNANSSGVPRLIAEHVGNSAWSPVGDLIAFTDFEGHVRVTAPDGSAQRTLATFPPDTEFRYLSWSRDGRRLAFTAEKQRPSD